MLVLYTLCVDTCKRRSRFLWLYSLRMMRNACGRTCPLRKVRDLLEKMLKISLLVGLMSQRLSFSQTLTMLAGKKIPFRLFFLMFTDDDDVSNPLCVCCSAFYKNMVKVAKCVTLNKVSLLTLYLIELQQRGWYALCSFFFVSPYLLGYGNLWLFWRRSYWKTQLPSCAGMSFCTCWHVQV